MALEKDGKDKRSNAGVTASGKTTESGNPTRTSVIAAGAKTFDRPIDEQKREQIDARRQRERNAASTKPTENGAGSQPAPEPKKNPPTGVTPLTDPKPMGATPYVEGADLLGIGTRFLGGIGGAVTSALTQGITGEDSTQSMLGEHLGKQTGWSADPSMTPGRDRAQRGTKRESFDQPTIGSATSTARDDEAAKSAPLPIDDFADIQLLDRRKPGLKQMLESML